MLVLVYFQRRTGLRQSLLGQWRLDHCVWYLAQLIFGHAGRVDQIEL